MVAVAVAAAGWAEARVMAAGGLEAAGSGTLP